MKLFTTKIYVLLALLLPVASVVLAQGSENFEGLPNNQDFFTQDGKTFTSNNTNFDVTTFNGAGSGGSNQFMDNFGATATGVTYSISTGGQNFTMLTAAFYASSIADGANPTNNGTIRVRGYENGTQVTNYDYTKTSGYPTDFSGNNGFFTINFGTDHTTDLSALNIDRLDITLAGAFQYIAMDDFVFGAEILETDPPFVNAITLNGTPNSTAPSVAYTVTFNEVALNVDASDFTVDAVGTSGTITSVTGSGTTYTVTVGSISGEGTISVDLLAGNNIADALGNTPSPAFTAGDNHTVSRCFQETFESFVDGDIMFSSNGIVFTTGTANFSIENFPGAGAISDGETGGSDFLVDNNADQGTNKVYTISTPGTEVFTIEAIDIYVSSELDGANPTNNGSITIRGLDAGGAQQYIISKNAGFPTNFNTNNGFTTIDFATEGAADYSLTNIEQIEITIGGAFSYVAIDNFEHCEPVVSNNPPIVQGITLLGDPEAKAPAVDFSVVFNENALNVTADDFSLDTLGTAVGTISGISGSGNTYTINVTGISGEGSIRVDLNAGTDIEDAEGNAMPDPFATGERHIVSQCDVETFEASAVSATTFIRDGIPFSTGIANFAVEEFIGAGAGASDRFLSNITNQVPTSSYSISIDNTSTIFMNSMEVYVSSQLNGPNPTNDGTLLVKGFLDNVELYDFTKTVFPTTMGATQGFSLVDFAADGASDFSGVEVDEIRITIGGSFVYVAMDNFKFCEDTVAPIAACMDFSTPLDATGTVLVSPTDIDNGSTDNASRLFLGLETTDFFTEADNTNTDELLGAGVGLFHINEVQVIAPTTGNYTPTTTNYAGGGNSTLILLYTETPVPNSGAFATRPGYAGGLQLDINGNFLGGDPTNGAGGFFTLQANTTYYMLISEGAPNLDHEAIVVFDMPIAVTAPQVFTCADAGDSTQTLYAFDGNGNFDTCTATLTIEVAQVEYTAAGWLNGDLPNLGTNVQINADYDSAIEGDIEGCACQIDNNAVVTVKAGNYIRTDGDIGVNTGSTLIVEHQGSIVQIKDDAIVDNSGTINVNVTTPELNGRDFMLMGSPMNDEIQGSAFASAARFRSHNTANFSPNAAVAATSPGAGNWVDEEGDDWINYTGPINPGEGYMFIGSLDILPGPTFPSYDLTFELGTLNNGILNYTAGFNTDQNSSPNIIANPYASAISATDFINANSTIVDAVYFWEHVTTPTAVIPGPYFIDYSMEDISVFNLTGGTAAAASDASTTPNGIISTGQGFGLKALQAGTIEFNNSMRRTTGNSTLRSPEGPEDRIWLSVTNETYNIGNTNLIGFLEKASPAFDAGYDATRMATIVSLFSHLEDGSEALTIQGREVFNEEMEIALGFSSLVQENLEYTIAIENIEGAAISEATAYLVDHTTGIITNLTEDKYTFRSEHGIQNSRFTLKFINDEELETAENRLATISMFPNPTQGIITIVSPRTNINSVIVTDIQGRNIQNVIITQENQVSIDMSAYGAAVYFVTINTDEGTITKRVLKK